MSSRIFLVFILLCIFTISSLAGQSISFRATVRNSTTKQSLAYATVYSSQARTGIYSDEAGRIDWELRNDDTITVSFLSYETKKIAVNSLESDGEILLKELAISLNTIVIKSSRERHKNYRIGFYDDPTEFDAWGITIGGMAVNFIANNTGCSGNLKTLLINLGKASNQSHRAKARVRIFAADKHKNGPGKDLLKENILFTIPRFSRYQKVDLTSFKINFPLEGIFIGVEFLGFETKEGLSKDWKNQTGGRITSTKRDDYKSVGASWRFPDTDGKLQWIPITDGAKHRNWERILFKIGADVESVD